MITILLKLIPLFLKVKFLIEKPIQKAACAWFFACSALLLMQPQSFTDLSFFQDINLAILCSAIALIYIILCVLDHLLPKWNITDRCLFSSFLFFICSAAMNYRGEKLNSFLLVLIIALFIVFIYKKEKDIRLFKEEFSKNKSLVIISVFVLVFTVISLRIAVLRYLTYSTPNFDFGIFVQMFHNMKTTGLPDTTCERDMFLSHFAVHVSPAYYLILPFYALFPSPITLQVAQVLIVYSGVVPFYLIAKKYGLSNKMLTIFMIIFCAYPALSAGCFYDLHENCFLVPFLLWMFYFFEKDKPIPMYIFAFLTCLVKEDAFIYVAIFALYILISRMKKLRFIILVVGSGAYFATIIYLMKEYGQGIMSGRFENLIYEDSGLLGVIKTALVNPAYIFTQIFSTKDGGTAKLVYCMQLFLPLGLLPFLSKKVSRCILIIPILINLITVYGYQYQIAFQYSFGISAFLLYLSIINISDIKIENAKYIASFAMITACLFFTVITVPKETYYTSLYSANKELYKNMDAILEQIPSDATVTAQTFLLPHIANRSVVYELEYHREPSTDLVILDMRYGYNTIAEKYRTIYEEAGYALIIEKENTVAIYRSPDYNPTFAIEGVE